MTFEQANKIGSVLDGYVKCTYAMLYSLGMAKVWSIQKSLSAHNVAKDELNLSVGYTAPDAYADDTVSLIVDYPVVIVDKAVMSQDGKMVQARLSDYIKNKIIEKAKTRLPGEKHEQYIKQLSIALDQPVWVKTVAIDWIPTNVDNATVSFVDENGETIANISAQIDVSKKKYNNAKAILAAATAVNFI